MFKFCDCGVEMMHAHVCLQEVEEEDGSIKETIAGFL